MGARSSHRLDRRVAENTLFARHGVIVMTLMLLVIAVQPHAMARQGDAVLTLADVEDSVLIDVGRSKAIKCPWTIKRVSVADPDIADIEVLDPNQLIVVGTSLGSTDLIIWSDKGDVWSTRIRVEVDLQQLNDNLADLFPDCSIEVSLIQDVYVISGIVERADQVEQLHSFLDASEIAYVDTTTLAGLQQVQLQVRIAEVNRVAIRKMGVNMLAGGHDAFGAGLIGAASGGAFNPISIGVPEGASASSSIPFVFTNPASVSPLVTLVGGFPRADLEFFIQALEENQYLRTLAEPNLVALSGEEASFLAGGEFPIPIVQGNSTGGGTSITIQYKEFGVRLRFKPVVLGGNRIRILVAPEVSELSNIGAVEIQGFSVPSVLTRRSETTLELQSGQSFVMAGLLNQSTNARSSRVPLLGDLPILGALFRSVSYQNGESELIVIVTASLVEPLSHYPARPLPAAEFYVAPNDWELFMNGDLEGKAEAVGPVNLSERGLGEAGFGRLKGPGGWASHYNR